MSAAVSSPVKNRDATPIVWQGRTIGELHPNGTWHKSIDARRHWARKHDAPGVQAAVWDKLRARGAVTRIEVFDKASGCTFSLSADEFEAHAVRDTLNPLDGEQLFAPRSTWSVEHPEGYQHRLALE